MLPPEKEEILKNLWLKNAKVSEIALVLGIRPDQVYVYAKVLGLPPRSKNSPSNAKIRITDLSLLRKMWEEGWSVKQIAEYFGTGEWTVRNYLRAMGLKRRPRVTCIDLSCNELEQLCVKGLTDKEIAKTYGISVLCVIRLREKCGINKRELNALKNKEKTNEIIKFIVDILNMKGFTTSIELRNRYNININGRLLREIEGSIEGIRWFRLKYTSTYKYTVFPLSFIYMTVIYLTGFEHAVVSYLKENTISKNLNPSVLKTLLRMNNAPEELIRAVKI